MGVVCLGAAGLWLALGIGGGAGGAVAAPAATAVETARAKAKLQAGAHALEEGEYEEALARFQEAFQIVPSPKIHFNFGLAYKGLARHAEALESFERFLDQAKDASASSRTEAEGHVAALRQRVGTLSVSCDTDGAEVRLDGRSLGTTPLAHHKIYVNAGPHQLVVQKGTDAPVVRAFTAGAGAGVTLSVNLVAAKAPVTREVSLGARPPPRDATPQPLVEATDHAGSDAAEKGSGHGWILWGLAGTLVAAAAVTLAIVLTRPTDYPPTNGGKLAGN